MDDPGSGMIGSHGYCTQELVNLCLFGRAYSNVFDGTKKLGSKEDGFMVLQGVPRKTSVGFLSLFEWYRSHEVGSRLKCPTLPIWVLVAESHYSTLFGNPYEIKDTKQLKDRQDVFYYDPFARQTETYRLTLELDSVVAMSTGGGEEVDESGLYEHTSTIERCIRTKWRPGARINWNGSEPVL